MIRALVLLAVATLLGATGQDPAARVCRLPSSALGSQTDTAAWCARDYLIRNGYTAASASTNRADVALEPSMDLGSSYQETLDFRRNTVGSEPLLACPSATGFLVSFAMPNQLNMPHGRGVSMTKQYAGLTLLRAWVTLSGSVPPHCSVPRLPPP